MLNLLKNEKTTFEIKEINGSNYKFVTKLTPADYFRFRFALYNCVKKILYEGMEDGQGVGFLLVSDFLAEAYLIQTGMECPPLVEFLIAEITEPVPVKGKVTQPLLDAALESEEGVNVVFDFFTEFVLNIIKMPKKPNNSKTISMEFSNLTPESTSSTTSDETNETTKSTEPKVE